MPVPQEEPPPNPFRGEEYLAAVGTFPYALPPGVAFPATVPAFDYPANIGARDHGEVVAYQWWGCSVSNAAWDAAAEGERDTATSFFAEIRTAVEAGAPGLTNWELDILDLDDAEAPGVGQSGLCRQWFDLLAAG